jgi:hypothetical protein
MVTQSATILERHLLLGQGPTQMSAHKAVAAFAFPGGAGAFAAGLAAAAVSAKIKRKRLVKEVRRYFPQVCFHSELNLGVKFNLY